MDYLAFERKFADPDPTLRNKVQQGQQNLAKLVLEPVVLPE